MPLHTIICDSFYPFTFLYCTNTDPASPGTGNRGVGIRICRILAATRKLADVTPLRNREDPTKLLPPPNLFQLDIRSPHSPPASSGGVQAGDVAVSGTTRTPEEHGAADILANMDFGGFQKHVDVGGSAEY